MVAANGMPSPVIGLLRVALFLPETAYAWGARQRVRSLGERPPGGSRAEGSEVPS